MLSDFTELALRKAGPEWAPTSSRRDEPGSPYRDALAFAPASQREHSVAVAITILFAISVAWISGIASQGAIAVAAFLPVCSAITVLSLVLTSTLLFSQYRATHHPSLIFLTLGYVRTGIFLLAFILADPLMAAPVRILGGGSQSGPWLYWFSHFAFIVCVGEFVVTERFCARKTRSPRLSLWWIPAFSIVTVLATLVLTFSYESILPKLVVDGRSTAVMQHFFSPLLIVFSIVVLVFLGMTTRFKTVVALWLGVILFATLGELLAQWLAQGRPFTYGWYYAQTEWVVATTAFYVALQARITNILAAMSSVNDVLRQQSLTDHLTGLLNKGGFNERLTVAARQCHLLQQPIAVIGIDVDDFKAYNDTFGHPAGDIALAAVGAVLRTSFFRPDDICGRIGGEEFAIVLKNTDHSGALTVAERVRRAVERLNMRHAKGTSHPMVTISIGIALDRAENTVAVADLMGRADAALYKSKARGRNCITIAPMPPSPERES